MDNSVIQFQFEDEASAHLAFDSLDELGYHPIYYANEHPGIHIHLDRCDLTSALEIAQMHGGILQESSLASAEDEAYGLAYHLDGIRIPAHVVNEDWSAEYAIEPGSARSDDEELARGDGEKFSYFSGEVNV